MLFVNGDSTRSKLEMFNASMLMMKRKIIHLSIRISDPFTHKRPSVGVPSWS